MIKTRAKVLFTLLTFAAFKLQAIDPVPQLEVGIGYRLDDVRWVIKPERSQFPNVKDTVRFEDMSIALIEVNARTPFDCWLYTKLQADYGWIPTRKIGERTTFNNRAFKASTSNYMKRGEVADFSLGIGNHFQLMAKRLWVATMIGFGGHTQRFKDKGSRTLSGDLLEQGFSPTQVAALGLSTSTRGSSYHTSWWGPWVGADVTYLYCAGVLLFGEIEYNFLSKCHVKRHSDTGIPVLDDYQKTKGGMGWMVKLGNVCNFCGHWYFSWNVNWRYWKAHHKDAHFSWHSVGLGGDLGYTF
jgi:hypothetical protein